MEWNSQFALEIIPQLSRGLIITIEATILGYALSLVLGLFWAIMLRSGSKLIVYPVKALVEFVYRTPLLVQLYFLFFILPNFGILLPALVCGILGIGLHSSVYTSEIYRAGIENVNTGQWEAAKALNYSMIQTWLRVIIPQAVFPMIPPLANVLIGMFKETALLSAVSVVELMGMSQTIARDTFRYFEPMTMMGLMYIAISIPAAIGTNQLEKRFGSVAKQLI